MNVFILNTGRCGSTTFIRACSHISNFSSAHESRSGKLHAERTKYPSNHIEADNRLSWFLGRLHRQYGDAAFYVHLKRGAQETARSFTMRYSAGIIKAYRDGILMHLPKDTDPMQVSLDYCETVNSNIECFLKDRPQKIELNLEDIARDFPRFWEMIGAEGDMAAALAEFRVKHNASQGVPGGDKSTSYHLKFGRKLSRLVGRISNAFRAG